MSDSQCTASDLLSAVLNTQDHIIEHTGFKHYQTILTLVTVILQTLTHLPSIIYKVGGRGL